MTQGFPFRRIARPFVGEHHMLWDGPGELEKSYIRQPGFEATDRLSVLRAFRLIDSDLARILEFVEPDARNSGSFSHRTYELLLRSCTEVESHCRSILRANSFPEPEGKRWTQKTFRKIEPAMRLSDYSVRFPTWTQDSTPGATGSEIATGFSPFHVWGESAPKWWNAYNQVKHNRSENLAEASLDTTVRAVSAVLVLLCAQFGPVSLAEMTDAFGSISDSDDGYFMVPPHFEVKVPSWPVEDRYEFTTDQWANSGQQYQDYPFK